MLVRLADPNRDPLTALIRTLPARRRPEDQVCGFVGSHGLPVDAPGCHVMAKVQVNGNHPIWKLAKSAFPGPVEWNFGGWAWAFEPASRLTTALVGEH